MEAAWPPTSPSRRYRPPPSAPGRRVKARGRAPGERGAERLAAAPAAPQPAPPPNGRLTAAGAVRWRLGGCVGEVGTPRVREGRQGGDPPGSPRSPPGRRCLCPGDSPQSSGPRLAAPSVFCLGERQRAPGSDKTKQQKKKNQNLPRACGRRVVKWVWGAPWLWPRSFRAGAGVRGCWGCSGCRRAARMSLKGLLQRCLSSRDTALEVILLLILLAV